MENKLQELTQKLYDEGLSKGRQEADTLLADAKEQAKKIVSEAEGDAARIRREARSEADDLKKNTLTELGLAGKQVMSELKASISNMIVAKAVSEPVKSATLDPAFVKDVLVAVAGNWQNNSSEKVTLKALLPADKEKELTAAMAGIANTTLAEGMEIEYSDKVKSGFRVGPKDGGYYINFTDDGFEALLSEYLRPKVSRMLYGTEE